MTLTPKQQKFVEEYLFDLNATAAAVRAGYSRRTADKQGPHLSTLPPVKKAIDVAKAARSKRMQVDADFVLVRLLEAVEADLADLYDDNGDLKPVKAWPDVFRRGLVQVVDIESVNLEGVEVGKVKKLRLSDRTRLLELLGKHVHVNAFQDQIHHAGFEGLGDRLERANRRLEANGKMNRVIIDTTPSAKAVAAAAELTPGTLAGQNAED